MKGRGKGGRKEVRAERERERDRERQRERETERETERQREREQHPTAVHISTTITREFRTKDTNPFYFLNHPSSHNL